MRTNGPCRCYENAGFHGSAVMAAKQMLREVLILRAKLDAAPKWSSAFEAWQKAQQLQSELDALKAAPAWIKTSERMPDETCDVLGVVDGVVMRLDYSDDEDAAYPWADEYLRVYADKQVSHWQPLPEPPK